MNHQQCIGQPFLEIGSFDCSNLLATIRALALGFVKSPNCYFRTGKPIFTWVSKQKIFYDFATFVTYKNYCSFMLNLNTYV